MSKRSDRARDMSGEIIDRFQTEEFDVAMCFSCLTMTFAEIMMIVEANRRDEAIALINNQLRRLKEAMESDAASISEH